MQILVKEVKRGASGNGIVQRVVKRFGPRLRIISPTLGDGTYIEYRTPNEREIMGRYNKNENTTDLSEIASAIRYLADRVLEAAQVIASSDVDLRKPSNEVDAMRRGKQAQSQDFLEKKSGWEQGVDEIPPIPDDMPLMNFGSQD